MYLLIKLYAMTYLGSEGVAPAFLISALDEDDQLHTSAALPPG